MPDLRVRDKSKGGAGMNADYEEYMEKREKLIKEGLNFPVATEIACKQKNKK